jgi:hypothetical protein
MFLTQNLFHKRLLYLIILLVICLSSISCKTSPQIKEPVKVWWGNAGDNAEWENARVVMENYNWIVAAR